MGECLRRACPCLNPLWDRICLEKKPSPAPAPTPITAPAPTPAPAPKPPVSHSIYTALWGFESRHPDELSFKEGDMFNVINRNGDWWTARKIDKNGCVLDTGIVPQNYLTRAESLQMQPWYFGTMNRFEAQSHLIAPENQDGAFLVRNSEKENVGYVLSVRDSSRVKHFKIFQTEEKTFLVDQTRDFSSLIDLVEHYHTSGMISSCRLGNPCKRKKPPTNDLNHFTVDDWELPKEEFTLEEELGRGYFSEVYRGRWKNMIQVAIKILKNDSVLSHKEFQREVQILKGLRHRHLISLFAVCTSSTPYYIITELMEKGSLLNFLREKEGQALDMMSLIDMSAQVADGMSYLEEQNSIHRDLAARNVLVGEGNICKVADFGLARVIKEPFYISDDKKIPYKWSAPEAISHGKFSIKSDVWSFGVLLYEITTYGSIPYPAYSNEETYIQVTGGYRMPIPPKCPEFIYQLMLKCWSANPDDRPSFRIVKSELDNSYELESQT
ncbi:protein-tyrosine kinase 6b [Xyrichtys novacula]|uniref:Tyrosine-protein kinase n=1 Tax=Xyrichtys novacula TaxID=13765 RepID=A0AAV1HEQ1_XYRNO|nr:protein-tyrosine kinase 6b [Xyrichtys novacula]